MGQVESKVIYIGSGSPDGYSGEMVTLTERTYLNLDKTAAVDFGPDAAFLLGNAGDQVHIEDAIKYGLLDEDTAPAQVAADTDELEERKRDLDAREEALNAEREAFEAEKESHAVLLAQAAAAQNDPPAAGAVGEGTGDAPAADGGEGTQDGGGVKEATAGDDKNTPPADNKSKGKGATK